MTTVLLCPHIASSPCIYRERQRSRVSLPLLLKTPVLLDHNPTISFSFNLHYLHKGPISKYYQNGLWSFNTESWKGNITQSLRSADFPFHPTEQAIHTMLWQMKTKCAIGNLSSVQYLQCIFWLFLCYRGQRLLFASTSIPFHLNHTWKIYYSALANHNLVLLNSLPFPNSSIAFHGFLSHFSPK